MKVFLTYLKKERRLHMEIEILSMLQKIRTPLLDIFMSNITKLGNAGIVWILLTIVLLLIPKTRKSGLILAAAANWIETKRRRNARYRTPDYAKVSEKSGTLAINT